MRNQSGIHQRLESESGSVLIIFLVMLAVLSTIAYGALRSSGMNYQTAKAFEKGKQSFYSAEMGVDTAIGEIIDEFQNLSVYTESKDYPGADADGWMTINDFNDYEVKYRITNPLEAYLYQTVLGNSVIYHYAHSYMIDSTATQLNGGSTESLKEEFRILETPLVQYYIFYGGSGNAADLEILPGPTMNSWGRIHANGDIYIGANNKFNLRNYDDNNAQSPHFMSTAGEVFLKRKNNGSTYPADRVEVKTSGTGTSFTPTEFITGDILTADEAAQETRFGEYITINEKALLAPGKTQFVRNGFYESRSEDPQRPNIHGIKIVGTGPLGSTGTRVYVSEPTYTEVTDMILNGTLPDSSASGVAAGSMVRESLAAFCDRRENRDVDLTDIDLYFLQTWYVAYLNYYNMDLSDSLGMLIYTSRSPDDTYTNQDTNLQAIRLTRWAAGSSPELLDETTLTTDNPLYVHQDFNTINTRGVALVSDAVNLLSNAFTTRTCGTRPNATNTTYYAAFFGGNVPTPAGGGTYSGGLENYPRFHESWSGDTAFIRGCFINLWTSSQATDPWGSSNVYSPPAREWGWDVRFQNPDFWPPFIPSVFSVERAGFLNKNS